MVNEERFFPPVRQEDIGALKGHLTTYEQGKRFVFSDDRNLPEGSIYSIVRAFKDPVRFEAGYVETHWHSVDSLWLFFGEERDLSGLTIEVTIGDIVFRKASPVCVFLPAGTKHTYRPVSGTGYYVNIVLAAAGRYNEATEVDTWRGGTSR